MIAPVQGVFPRNPSAAASILDLTLDVKRDFGASGSSQSTTGSISAGSNVLTLTNAIDFQGGQGISIANAGPLPTISAPGAPTVTATGTTGTTTWAYAVAALDGKGGETAASPVTTITNGNATLSSTNYNAISWTAVSGAAGYAVYRTTAGGTPNTTGLIAVVNGTSLNDTGLATIASPQGVASAPPPSALGDLLVTTIQGGAGTTSLILAAAASTTVSGVTVTHDDTAAIQAALNAINSAGGGTVTMDGTMVVSSPLTIYANTIFRGSGQQSKLLVSPSFQANAFTTGVTMVIAAPNGGSATGIVIQDMTIDGSSSLVPGVCGFLANGAAGSEPTIGAVLERVTFNALTGRGVLAWAQAKIEAVGCQAINCGGDAGFRSTYQGSSLLNEITLIDCVATGCAQSGFFIDGVKNATLVACKAYNQTAGGATANGISVGSNCTLIGCETYNNTNAGIYVIGSNNRIIGCITHNNNLGCDLYSGSAVQTGNRVIGCISYNQTTTSAGNVPKGFSGYNQSELLVADCVSFDNGDANGTGVGMDFDQTDFAIFANNQCYDDRSTKYQVYGIHIRSSGGGSGNIRLLGNDVTGNQTQGIVVDSGISYVAALNPGYNPVGVLTAPAIPASGTAVTNTFGIRVRVFISGGAVSAIAINGTATGLTSGTFELDPGETITLTYTSAPTWTWFGL